MQLASLAWNFYHMASLPSLCLCAKIKKGHKKINDHTIIFKHQHFCVKSIDFLLLEKKVVDSIVCIYYNILKCVLLPGNIKFFRCAIWSPLTSPTILKGLKLAENSSSSCGDPEAYVTTSRFSSNDSSPSPPYLSSLRCDIYSVVFVSAVVFVFEHAYTHQVSFSAITWEFHDIPWRHIWCILLNTVCTYTTEKHMHANVLFCKDLTDVTGQKHPCICISMPQQILLCPHVPLCKQGTAPGLLRPHRLHKMMNLSWCPLVLVLLWHP